MKTTLHQRLQAVAGGLNNRELSELTAVDQENVRRYMNGSAPSVKFLAALCCRLNVNGDWLLTGRGQMQTNARMRGGRDPRVERLLASIPERRDTLLAKAEALSRVLAGALGNTRGGGGGRGARGTGGRRSGKKRAARAKASK